MEREEVEKIIAAVITHTCNRVIEFGKTFHGNPLIHVKYILKIRDRKDVFASEEEQTLVDKMMKLLS